MSKTSGVLYVATGLASRRQVEETFKRAIDGLTIPCRFRVNLVLDRDGQRLGHAYVWITSKKVINALEGKNYDGSDRTERIDDPSWEPPTIPLDKALEELNMSSIESPIGSWADEVNEFDIHDRYTCPQITKPLQPLTTIPSYNYSRDQLKYIRQHEGDDAPIKGKLDNISRAFEPRVDDGCCQNVLVCRRVPNWINKNDMGRILKPYFPNSNEYYPQISLLDRGDYYMAFITFNEGTQDALDIYHMIRRLNIYKPNLGTSEKATIESDEPPKHLTSLVFSFAYDNASD